MQSKEELLQELRALQTKCAELMNKIEQIDEPKFERVPINENYFTFVINYTGVNIYSSNEDHDCVDDTRFDNNNYFKTLERAQEVAEKIKFLLKLERYHDIFCPDFLPDWDDFNSCKYTIFYDHDHKIYKYVYCYLAEHRTLAFFPTEEIAKKVCDILNKECENNDKS